MKHLVEELISSGYLKTPDIIAAFQKIDRKDFVPDEYKDRAYVDAPLPIGFGQTISQSLTVAFMLELLRPKEGDKIMEAGSGSGWQTALLARIVGEKGRVFAIEIIPELEKMGRRNVSKYDFVKSGIVEFHCFNAIGGLPEKAPFDGIIAAASAEEIPEEWKKQLKEGGRLVMPIKDKIFAIEKKKGGGFETESYPGFAFVPFVSK